MAQVGRPKDIESPEILWGLFQDYKKFIKANPCLVQDFVGKDADEVHRKKEQPLTMEGFENYVADKDGPMTLDQYFSNRAGAYAEFVAICSRIKRVIREDQIIGGMVGIYNPSITQRINNLTEKIESTSKVTTTTVDVSKLSDEAIQEIIDAENRSDPSEG